MDPQDARSSAVEVAEDERFFLRGRIEIAFAPDDLIHRATA